MLVLSRKKNESIIINDNITIVVVEIRGDKVRLGIEAPKNIPVHRQEIYEQIQNAVRGTQSGFVCESCGKAYDEIGNGVFDEDAVFVCDKCCEKSDPALCTLNSSSELPVTKMIDGIETTFVDQDDDWDSTEHDSHDTMINEGCPNTERKGAS